MGKFLAISIIGLVVFIIVAVGWQALKKIEWGDISGSTLDFFTIKLPPELRGSAEYQTTKMADIKNEVPITITTSGGLGTSVGNNSVITNSGVTVVVGKLKGGNEALSSAFGKVHLNGVHAPNTSGIGSEVSLSASLNSGEKINITGWQIKTNFRTVAIIPQAILDFPPSGLYKKGDIILEQGNSVRIYGRNTVFPGNFRENKCMGFLSSTYKTSVDTISTNCPQPYNSNELVTLPGACQTIIRSIWRCQTPSVEKVNEAARYNSSLCREILDRFNYGYCYNHHRGDSDFMEKQWRVWYGLALEFDREHDRVLLLDKDLKVVDEYIY